MQDFKAYSQAIEQACSEIPESRLVFWGGWICENLWSVDRQAADDWFNEQDINLAEVMQFVAKSAAASPDQAALGGWCDRWQGLDESLLDTTAITDKAIYELVITLDSILNYLQEGVRGWELQAAQATMNVIDVMLDEQALDILKPEGFSSQTVQDEIASQLAMIDYLKSSH